jgi:hypothetical protein
MDFVISIDDERGKSLIAFLKKLDFVVLRPFKSGKNTRPTASAPSGAPSYFGACPDWDIEADVLRKQSSPRRTL